MPGGRFFPPYDGILLRDTTRSASRDARDIIMFMVVRKSFCGGGTVFAVLDALHPRAVLSFYLSLGECHADMCFACRAHFDQLTKRMVSRREFEREPPITRRSSRRLLNL